LATTVESEKNVTETSRALSVRGMRTSVVLHAGVLTAVLLIPAQAMSRPQRAKKQLDVVFYRAPLVTPPPRAIQLPLSREGTGLRPLPGPGRPAPRTPEPKLPGPDEPGNPEFAKGPDEGPPVAEAPPQQKVGNAGILAFRDKFASLAQDKLAPRLGADARYSDADEVGQASSRSMLTTNTPGGSGGINVASLSRRVGGGGGGGGGINGDGTGGGGGGGMPGVPVGRATSAIAGIGGGDRPLARDGPGPSRTDEEIQIVFDRYKASFYRLYNRELRNDPTLKGQMVLRLTIEPDGSVSMCVLQSTDMKAPDLSAQVVHRVRTISFGPKEGVPALTIVYPIDFLPAA
jgi:hypothetical protein